MADKLLKSIKFPTLPDRYVIGDSTLTEEGAAADAKAVGDALATKADTSGTYEDLIVGGAEQLMADGYETDKDPYLFRSTGGSADVGNREYVDKIVGGTVAWNQLVTDGNFTDASSWITNNATMTVSNNIGTVTQNNSSGYVNKKVYTASGHRCLAMLDIKGVAGKTYSFNNVLANFVADGTWQTRTGIFTASDAITYFVISQRGEGGFPAEWQIRNACIFDLTALFNPTIADYIYSLEQSQAGAGVAWFRNYFSKDYYPYDAGTLRSVEGVSAHETVGFNQWDEEWESGYYDASGNAKSSSAQIRSKNLIQVIPNAEYYTKMDAHRFCFYDSSKTFIGRSDLYQSNQHLFTVPSNCHYIKFHVDYTGTYNHDICINLSDPTRNGEYEPYQKHTYSLDSSLTLRGVPKLADGKLAFDGDVYPPSGEVQRRYGLRAYQSGDESLTDAITDGTNTVYKLATPTTETAEGYEQYQRCDPSGTEEFVTTGIVPVGHETRYPHDLKKKIETAPDSPSADGTYLMKRSGGKNTYMALPSTPSANGAYVLTVTVSGGSASYSWTAKE